MVYGIRQSTMLHSYKFALMADQAKYMKKLETLEYVHLYSAAKSQS